jgi:hypothetical protein
MLKSFINIIELIKLAHVDLMMSLKDSPPKKWVSVKDRLPIEFGYYDVITYGKPSYKDDPIEKYERLYWDGKGIGRVTHWAELPEVPHD